jgi:hypothetical protein
MLRQIPSSIENTCLASVIVEAARHCGESVQAVVDGYDCEIVYVTNSPGKGMATIFDENENHAVFMFSTVDEVIDAIGVFVDALEDHGREPFGMKCVAGV